MAIIKSLPAAQEAQSAPTPQILEAMLRNWVRFCSIFGLGMFVTLLYVLGSHKKYQSNMSLLVENTRRQQSISADAGNQDTAAPVTEEDLYSQVELLGSVDVLNEVVDPGWSSAPFSSHSRAQESEHEAKVAKLRGRLVIAPVRKSHVIDVSYTATDPQVATDTLRRVLTVYLAHEKNVSSPAGAAGFFNEEANHYQTQWKDAQADLSGFQQAHHMVSVEQRETALGTAMNDALTLKRAAEAERAEVQRRLEVEQKQLSSTHKQEETSETVVPSAGSIDQSQSQLTQLELRRSQLITEYLPTDRIVQQTDAQIAAAKQEVTKAEAMNARSVTTSINPTWQGQDEQIAQDRAHLNAVAAREAAIEQQVSDLEGQLRQAEQDTVQFSSLQQNVSTLAGNYQLYLQKGNAAQISESMDARGLINIGVAQSPTFSLGPVRPRPFVDTLLGTVTALLLASFAVYLAEANRRTITSSVELGIASRYPVLATVSLNSYEQGAHRVSRT